MGLTIHYKLRWEPPNPPPNDVSVLRFVEDARRRIMRLRLGQVSKVTPAASTPGNMAYLTLQRVKLAEGCTQEYCTEVKPNGGYVFTLDPGEDCEPAHFGLCRYPEKTRYRFRDWPTKLTGWRMMAFSKTQYASLHGWEHFCRCHLAVLAALGVWRELGAQVKISDEGEYWPRRNLRALRRNLDLMNGAVAGAAGAMKDLADEQGGAPIESRIIEHPQFERLEAEGIAQNGERITAVVRAVRRAARP